MLYSFCFHACLSLDATFFSSPGANILKGITGKKKILKCKCWHRVKMTENVCKALSAGSSVQWRSWARGLALDPLSSSLGDPRAALPCPSDAAAGGFRSGRSLFHSLGGLLGLLSSLCLCPIFQAWKCF